MLPIDSLHIDTPKVQDKINTDRSVLFFREAAPYIHYYRGKTFVIAFSGEVIASKKFYQIMQDLAIFSAV